MSNFISSASDRKRKKKQNETTIQHNETKSIDSRGVARIFTLGAQKLSAEGARIEAPKAPRGVESGDWGGVSSSPTD